MDFNKLCSNSFFSESGDQKIFIYCRMKQIIRFQYYLQKGRLAKGFQMRLNFITESVGSLCFFVLHLLVAKLIIQKFHFVSWSVSDYWVLIATFLLFTYLSFFLFWRGINWTLKDITQGTFDFVLLTPINARLKSFIRGGSHNNVEAIFFSIALLVYVSFHFQLSFSLLSIILYILTLISGLWFTHCIDVIFLSLNFKFGKIDETIGPVFNFQQAMKYPAELFVQSPLFIKLIIFPISLLTTIPAIALLWKSQSLELILVYIVIIIVVSIVSEVMWRWGIKNYTSAS